MNPRLTVKEALAEVFDPAGKTIVDVGCGDGAIVRHFAQLGAKAMGIEVSEAQLEHALSKAGEGETYHVASGESLPCADAWAGAVLYLNSFHHLPLHVMGAAPREATRVLAPGGTLAVIEPLAEGNYFEAMRPIEDETEVRAAAYTALKSPPAGLAPDGEFFYHSVIRRRDSDHFLEAVTAPDPARRERLPQVESELRRRYDALAQFDEQGAYFIAPMRRNVFRKQA
jgi:SAM-dependent methyltransferase